MGVDRRQRQITGEPMKFLTLADWTGMVETELFARDNVLRPLIDADHFPAQTRNTMITRGHSPVAHEDLDVV